MSTKCSIIPEFMMAEIAEKVEPVNPGKFTAALNDIHNFMAGLDVFKSPAGFVMDAKGGRNRMTYDCDSGYTLPGKLARDEKSKKHAKDAVNRAHEGSGHVYDFFKEVFGRNSIDNKGFTLCSNTDYGVNYGNAFWNSEYMVYGAGDGEIFNCFTSDLDVIAHEISHGVTEHTANLIYQSQPGALNEATSDIFGSLTKQYALKQTAEQADWLLGANLFTDNVDARALRDLANPGTAFNDPIVGSDSQTNHMDNYNHSSYDNYCVHINSGIINRAFHHAAMSIGGNAWERAGKIWYQALSTRFKKDTKFQPAAEMVVQVAADLYGKGSKEQKAFQDGFKLVGIKA